MTVFAHTEVNQDKLDEVPVTIKITLQLGSWRAFVGMIPASRWPSSDVHAAITEAVSKIEKALAQCGAGPMRDDE